jgi:phospholipid/cholesterol/gamma-HCH transport system substrate-binding protein
MMNERVVQFRVGVMVLATLLITAILVVMFNDPRSWFRGSYTIQAKFPQAPGVTKSTPIRKSGILIGRVSHVDLKDGRAVVTAKIDGNRRLRHNEVFRIVDNLLGDTVVEVVPSSDPAAPRTFIQAGEEVEGVVAADATQVIANLQEGLSEVIGSVSSTSRELGSVVHKIGEMLDQNEEQIYRVIARADETLMSVQEVANNTNEVVGDKELRDQLKQTMAELPQTIRDAHRTINRMDQAMATVDKNLQHLEGLTRPLGERGETVVAHIDRSAAKLDRLMSDLLIFSQALNDQQGSLGRLVHDPEIYQHLNRAAKNIDEISWRLKPIVEDVRTFSDKIARHPEKLGVRGMLQRSPGIK